MIVNADTQLSRNDTRLFIYDESGRVINPQYVTYSVSSTDGSYHSGLDRPALLNTDGSYFIPWQTPSKSGPFIITWSYRIESRIITVTSHIFVLNPNDVDRMNEFVGVDLDSSVSKVFLSNTDLTPGDLRISFRDDYGQLQDPFVVYWSIFDSAGSVLMKKMVAEKASLGRYYAAWRTVGRTGDYKIFWEWCDTNTSPLVSKSMDFSIVNPRHPTVFGSSGCSCRCDCNMPVCGCSCVCQKVNVKFDSNWCQNGC